MNECSVPGGIDNKCHVTQSFIGACALLALWCEERAMPFVVLDIRFISSASRDLSLVVFVPIQEGETLSLHRVPECACMMTSSVSGI